MTNGTLQLGSQISLCQIRRETVEVINNSTHLVGIIAQALREFAQRRQRLLQMLTLVGKQSVDIARNAIDILHDIGK